MPTGNKVEVTLCLTDGTKLTRIEDLADITTFLEQHEEYVKIVRCKDCKHKPTGSGVNHDITFPEGDYKCPCRCEDFWYSWIPDDDWFCGNGERKDEVDNG